MISSKRMMDILFSTLLIVLLFPLLAVLSVALLLAQGRPVFYVADRMRTPNEPFKMIKFRTMEHIPRVQGICGGEKSDQITPMGRWLRSSRLDELPQLWNILKGDMSFVGPRPPLPEYVYAYPDIYADVLKVTPGVTGLATLAFKTREMEILRRCRSAVETHRIYCDHCVPRKARIDRHYARNRSLLGDFLLVFQTIGDLARRV